MIEIKANVIWIFHFNFVANVTAHVCEGSCEKGVRENLIYISRTWKIYLITKGFRSSVKDIRV